MTGTTAPTVKKTKVDRLDVARLRRSVEAHRKKLRDHIYKYPQKHVDKEAFSPIPAEQFSDENLVVLEEMLKLQMPTVEKLIHVLHVATTSPTEATDGKTTLAVNARLDHYYSSMRNLIMRS